MIVGRLIAFKGNEDYLPERDVLVEVTEVKGSRVEVAFDGPTKGVRTYLSLDIGELAQQALNFAQDE